MGGRQSEHTEAAILEILPEPLGSLIPVPALQRQSARTIALIPVSCPAKLCLSIFADMEIHDHQLHRRVLWFVIGISKVASIEGRNVERCPGMAKESFSR